MEISAVKLRQDLFKILSKVNETHTEITITKRGKPVAKIVHVSDRNNEEDPLIGIMKGCGKSLGDLVQPVIDPADWEID